MGGDFGLKIGVEGEKEFKNAINVLEVQAYNNNDAYERAEDEMVNGLLGDSINLV